MLMILMIGLMSFGACFLVLCCFLDRSEVGLRSTQTGGRGQGIPELRIALNGRDGVVRPSAGLRIDPVSP